MITSDLLQNRINNFWGYGSFKAPVWFVGMDERFNPKESQDMLEKQFKYAESNMVDGMLNASRSKITEWRHLANMGPFTGAELQTTWKYPIALYLYLQSGVPLTVDNRGETIIQFQKNILADADKKEVATLELSPLPCPSTRPEDWLYNDCDILDLSSRKEYEKIYLPKRAEVLKELIRLHGPKLVIFYSIKYLPYWIKIIGEEPQQITRRTLFIKKENNTAFCVIPNGGQSGLSYNELYEYADKIKDQISSLSL